MFFYCCFFPFNIHSSKVQSEDEVIAAAEKKFEKEKKLVEMLKEGRTTLEIYGFDKLVAARP